MAKEFEIWIEGYAATGERGYASFIGKAIGETFEEACINFEEPEDKYAEWGGDIKTDPVTGKLYTVPRKILSKGQKLNLDEKGHGGRPSIWACRLFDNEADARKSFG